MGVWVESPHNNRLRVRRVLLRVATTKEFKQKEPKSFINDRKGIVRLSSQCGRGWLIFVGTVAVWIKWSMNAQTSNWNIFIFIFKRKLLLARLVRIWIEKWVMHQFNCLLDSQHSRPEFSMNWKWNHENKEVERWGVKFPPADGVE